MLLPGFAPQGRAFRPLFDRWSRRIRARLALEHVLTGATTGLLLGAAGSVIAWQARLGALRPAGLAIGLLGAAGGIVLARRRRFSDVEVALYLDGRLGAAEAIVTGVELSRAGGSGEPAHAVVIARAAESLARATSRAVRTPILRPWHAPLPVAAAAIAVLSCLPLPPAPAAAAPETGSGKVHLAQIAGLEKVIRLAAIDARDAAQRERLKKLADEATRIRAALREGVAKREAQADVAKLRDALTAERLSLGDGEQRAGLEAAAGKLGESPDLQTAAKALGDRDLVRFDEAMEKLAGKLEKSDRARAQKVLEDAAEAARQAGAPGVAKALEEERRRLDALGKKNDKLRELAKALGDATAEGRKRLDEELKRLAEASEPGSGEAERQKALDDAQEGAGETEGELRGGAPLPIPVAGDGKGTPGHSDDGGPGGHKGKTAPVEGGALVAHAGATINKGRPMPGVVTGRTAGRTGATANVVGEGALGSAAPGELGGIERSDVPEEYREQVGRYFQPR